MLNKVLDYIKSNSLIDEYDNILLALSGGPDSVALFYIFLELTKIHKFSFGVAHVNHGLRVEAKEDEKFCKNLANSYKIEFYSLNSDIKSYAKEHKLSEEEAGREVRYNYFEKISKKYNYNKIATGHNLDDNVETFMFRLMRGTSIQGLLGIKNKRDKIIRPLLNIKKIQILQYLRDNNYKYCIDKTNFSNIYTRNKIRLELIPLIEKEFNNNFKDKIVSLMDEINELDDYVNGLYDFDYSKKFLSREEIKKYPLFIRKRVIREFLIAKGISYNRKIIDEICSLIDLNDNKHVTLDKENNLKFEYDKIIFEKSYRIEIKPDKIMLEIPNKIVYTNYVIITEWINPLDSLDKNCYYFDYDKIEKPLMIRTRLDGDKISLFGLKGNKKVKKIFIDKKISKSKRDLIPLIVSGEEIMMVGRLAISDEFSVDKDSKKIFTVKIEEVL